MLAEEEENDAGGAAEVQGLAVAGGRNRDAVACCGSILEKTAWGRGGPGTRTTLLDLGENLEKTAWGRGR